MGGPSPVAAATNGSVNQRNGQWLNVFFEIRRADSRHMFRVENQRNGKSGNQVTPQVTSPTFQTDLASHYS